MGKPTGFLDYQRVSKKELPVEERIQNFNDFHLDFDEKTRREQAARCMNCGVPFCQSAMRVNNRAVGCPLANLIPEWNHLVYKGLYEEAYYRLEKTAPFPEFTGNVCPALCEACCSCSIHDDAVGIRANELFLISEAFRNGWIQPKKDILRKNKKIAVIGSGPSGLACAKTLNDAGFRVSVFERNDRFGGLLMYGIPNMKLEKNIVERRIQLLKEEGIQFFANVNVGKDISIGQLEKDYDHVVFCCGTSEPRRLQVKNANVKNILYAVDFLTQTTKDLLAKHPFRYDTKGLDVVVIGGGDTGNDCVGTCVRQKAKSVTVLEMMKEPPLENTLPWPNYPNKKKTDYGILEAETVYQKDIHRYETTIDEVVGEEKIEGIYVKKVRFDKGKRTDVPDTREYLKCDVLLVSMGFVGTSQEDLESCHLKAVKNRVLLDGFRYSAKISVCGDMKNGQSLVVSAIKDGVDCAEEIIRMLSTR